MGELLNADEWLPVAARLRAEGNGWAVVARAVDRPVEEVLRQVERNPGLWSALWTAAECRVTADAAAEAVFVLRGQLRLENDRLRQSAARALVQYRVARDRVRRPAVREPAPTSESLRVAAHLEALTDAERDRLLDRVLPALVDERLGRGGGDRPGP